MSGDGPYAGVVSRGTAFVLDAVIVLVLTAGGLVAAGVVGLVVSGAWPRVVADISAPLLLYLPPLLLALYNTAFWAVAGRTPGMALLGLRVGRANGQALGAGRALLRALTLMIVTVGALWSLVDARRQGLHDKVAGTVVRYEGA